MLPGARFSPQQYKAKRAKRRGHPQKTIVTVYWIKGDSTHVKRNYAKTKGRVGWHYINIERKMMLGHNLFQAVYEAEGYQFRSFAVYC